MLEGGEQITNTDTNLSNTSTSKWDPSLIPANVSIPTGVGGINIPSIEQVTGQLNTKPVDTKTNTQSNTQTSNQTT